MDETAFPAAAGNQHTMFVTGWSTWPAMAAGQVMSAMLHATRHRQARTGRHASRCSTGWRHRTSGRGPLAPVEDAVYQFATLIARGYLTGQPSRRATQLA